MAQKTPEFLKNNFKLFTNVILIILLVFDLIILKKFINGQLTEVFYKVKLDTKMREMVRNAAQKMKASEQYFSLTVKKPLN
jgi:hypothetical protein